MNFKKLTIATLLATVALSTAFHSCEAAPARAPIRAEMFSQPIAETREYLSERVGEDAEVLETFDALAAAWEKHFGKRIYLGGLYNFNRLLAAVRYAAEKQEAIFFGSTPAIGPALKVTRVLWKDGAVHNLNVLTASILRLTTSHGDATFGEIEEMFGSRVRKTVESLTRDPELSRREWRQKLLEEAPELSLGAKHLLLAIRLRIVRRLDENPPANWSERRLERIFKYSANIAGAVSGTNAKLEKAILKIVEARYPTPKPL